MAELILDTNLPLIAKGVSNFSAECIEACKGWLDEIFDNQHLIVIDDEYHLLDEYRNSMDSSGPQDYGNRFLKWIYTNQGNPALVKQVHIHSIGGHDFSEFPESLRQIGFDRSDRKFVALAIANNCQAPIIQAGDSKWIGWQGSLAEHGVNLILPCLSELKMIYKKKMGE